MIEQQAQHSDAIVAVYGDHQHAEEAIKRLAASGFAMKDLSVVGKGYHTEEAVLGFYNAGDRIKVWGTRGAFWGGLWGLFVGGLFLSIPAVGPVFVLGSLAVTAFSAIEGAVLVGGMSAVGAALYGAGIPDNSVIDYEEVVKADGFLVMAHGTSEEMARAKAILDTGVPSRIDRLSGLVPGRPHVSVPLRGDPSVEF